MALVMHEISTANGLLELLMSVSAFTGLWRWKKAHNTHPTLGQVGAGINCGWGRGNIMETLDF